MLARPLVAAALALACGRDSTAPPDLARGVRLVGVPGGDTILALAAQPLVVEVGAPRGTVVVFRAAAVPYPRNGTGPSLYFSRSPDGRAPRDVDTLTTDDRGRASMYVRLGGAATEAIATVTVPALADSVQTRITVRPGAPVRVVAAPRDTAVYVGRSYALQASRIDRFGNSIPSGALTFAVDSAAVAVGAGGAVSGLAIGRASIVVQDGTYADTTWASVVPEGRIAAVKFGVTGFDRTELVLVDLDGSAYRTFPLQPGDVPPPAWHPNGGYLVASLLPAAGSLDPARRLAALDTATGVWRSLQGTPGPYGDGSAEFSRDGQWIYVANSPTNPYFSGSSAIYRVRSDGSAAAETVGYDRESATVYDHPSPSPDGSRVAITVDVSFGMYTRIVPAAPPLGSTPQEATLIDGLPTGGHPRWSPVSDDVLMFGSEGMWLMRAGANTVADRRYLAAALGSVAHVTGGYQGASWSADGRWIVAKASSGMILVEVATDRVLPLAFGAQLTDPAWRPR
jgi:hypothetical protein